MVWEGKENFRGFHDFRGFRGINLADFYKGIFLHVIPVCIIV